MMMMKSVGPEGGPPKDPDGVLRVVCRSCKAGIYMIRSEKGKYIPCNRKRLTVVTLEGKTVSGYESHFATCPFAGQYRGKK